MDSRSTLMAISLTRTPRIDASSEEIILTKKSGSVEHPLTRQTMQPRPLFGEAPKASPVSTAHPTEDEGIER